jgi:hypothetical protein
MAVDKKKRQRLMDDPAVEAALNPSPKSSPSQAVERGVYGRIAKARSRTAAQRKKAERDRQRSKVTYDWPEEIIQEVAERAAEMGCPASHLAAALCLEGLKAVDEGRLDVLAMRVPANSPRFDWYLDLERQR